jgi:lipopolysaccharide transport system ATP-binding protein
MMLRLAFAVASSAQPEVLVMDEWLATGDKEFTAKASDRLKQLVGGAKLLVLASHNTGLLKTICNKAILMEHGRVVDFDASDKIIDKYMEA